MIKVLIVDDSAFMRKAIAMLLEKNSGIQVVGAARNGQEGLDMVAKLDPDVVTLDIEMPVMDGLTALQRIMKDYPRPVIMVSSLTREGAEETLKAMDYGAMDFVPKPQSTVSLDIINLESDLQNKIMAVSKRKGILARVPIRPSSISAAPAPPASRAVVRPAGKRLMKDVVAIGVSTGGPPAVQKVLSALPADFPVPILIAQHMPAAFTGPFARRLDNSCAVSVKEAEHGELIKNGTVYISPGGIHMRMGGRMGRRTIEISEEPKSALYKPSANELIASVGEALGSRALAVVLTGMGSDGLEGVKVVKSKFGRAIAQSDATCVVYGMPKAIVDAGLADEIVDIDKVAHAIMENLYK